MAETQDIALQALRGEILDRRNDLLARGDLPTPERLSEYYARFAEEFGPQALSGLDGQDLLEKMHLHGNKESLVYWLEFKNDEELPNIFGGIGGGSAYKFGLFRRKENGAWVVGNRHDEREVSVNEAVEVARKHRDQLLRGLEVFAAFPTGGADEDYLRLQKELELAAPDIQDSAWARKYFHMLAPGKLDDFHNQDYDRFYVAQTLQLPPEPSGRYICSGRFVALCKEMSIPMTHLTSALVARIPKPYSYWAIKVDREHWDEMRDQGIVALEGTVSEDLSGLSYKQASKDRVLSLVKPHLPDSSAKAKHYAQQLFHFATFVSENDVVLAVSGSSVLGIGKVTGAYRFDPSSDVSHQRETTWVRTDEWSESFNWPSGAELLARLRSEALWIEIEKRMLEPAPLSVPGVRIPPRPKSLSGVPGRVQQVLERKGQVILYGPPGTGKTHWAISAATQLAAQRNLGSSYGELALEDAKRVFGAEDAFVRMCTFHPAYGYEDFIEGYRPQAVDGSLTFVLRSGMFKQLCEEACADTGHTYYLIIDEINRGDIPRIFGELLTLLELSKRDLTVALPLSGDQFHVPRNVHVIGTMNTADRSIALLDTALRRRFGFVELMPDSAVLGSAVVGQVPLGPWLDSLNSRIREHLGADARNLQVGHSFLMEHEQPLADVSSLRRALREDILPLLQEYCYDDWERLESILGQGVVDAPARAFRSELFDPGAEEKLQQALLAPDPELATSGVVVAADEELTDEESEDDVVDVDGSLGQD